MIDSDVDNKEKAVGWNPTSDEWDTDPGRRNLADVIISKGDRRSLRSSSGSRKNCEQFCMNLHKFKFSHDKDVTTYTSESVESGTFITFANSVSYESCSTGGAVATSTSTWFDLGETVDCWEASGGGNLEAAREHYECESDPCWKLVDPAVVLGNKRELAAKRFTVGLGMLVAGPVCICLGCFYYKMTKSKVEVVPS